MTRTFPWPADVHPLIKDKVYDRSMEHSFEVRDRQYHVNRKKMNSGSAIGKVVAAVREFDDESIRSLHSYHCDLEIQDQFCVEKGVKRYDHVALRRKVRDRVTTIAKAFKGSFVVLINFQVPGDPPINVVVYIAVPRIEDVKESSSSIRAFFGLFKRYIDIPYSYGVPRLSPLLGDAPNQPHADGSLDPLDLEELERWNLQFDGSGEEDDTEECEELPDSSSGSSSGNDGARGRSRERVMKKRYKFFGGNSNGDLECISNDSLGSTSSNGEKEDSRKTGLFDTNDFRNARFKLIPEVEDGPWVVRRAVGTRPTLLGTKVKQRYFRGEDYMEIDIDIGSSAVASNIVGLCRGYARNLTVNLGILFQGEKRDELPERLLAVINFNRMDLRDGEKIGPIS